ncbi:Minor allergen Alt a 7 [Hondaea fermentalgiana]|uniref:Minor allergen Alt a 7 n=1 Tax=Hondaea fermentalgiana TaxID=2315210 RepID=A0A2R5GVY9_9STRA|nr:Minor allergen Alt a 7 [Hondaea fermentalgiana]|eukprot:GBG32833.1 Minor allergen Alt a 7 [Hondaea fermentalgiana]
MSAPKIAIVYYSMYGHILKLADTMSATLTKAGCSVKTLQVQETLPENVLEMMHAPPKADHPIATPEDLVEADGVLFGIPTRFGMAPAQMKAFMDMTGQLWGQQKLLGKPAGIFFSTASMGGGQETTALTFVTQLTHHGMVFVPLGFPHPGQSNLDEVHGGSAYGAGTLAGGDGSRMPSELELSIAEMQATNFAKIVKKLAAKDEE